MGAHINIQTHLLGDKRVGQIVDSKTLGNDETIQEAIDYGYVVGKKEVIGQSVKGVLKSMSNGVQKDGNGRKINEYISLQAFAKGKLDDITDDLDKSKISVSVRARALKELQADTSGWTFTVEGSSTDTISITSITTGEVLGEIVVTEKVDINGFGLDLGTSGSVSWAVPAKSKSGTVAASKISGGDTRLTILGDALSELASAEYEGETIVFTVKIGTATVVKSAILRIAA